jgi:hypothetical protein
VWALLGVLLVTVALIFSAREDRQGYPSVTNMRASGYAAFAELLRRDGYQVRLERGVRPEFARDEVVIAVTRPYFNKDDAWDAPLSDPRLHPHEEQILQHLENGGAVIELINWEQFERASGQAVGARTVVSASDPARTYLLSLPNNPFETTTYATEATSYGAWFLGEYSYVDYTVHGDGMLVTVGEGLPLTNRFLDREQNAEFGLALVRSVAPRGSKLVFDESGIGNAEAPSVANTLGPWAVAARWQAILLFVVLLYTLSRRFGLPETEKRAVRASRELFDAVSDVLRRTGNTGLALDNLLIECDQRMRRVLNAPGTMKRSDLLQAVPAALREQYLRVSEHANANVPSRKATEQAARLLALLEAFERDSREVRGLKR